jgi:hypothetical protein
MNKVVARYADGRVLKGMTADFFPGKDLFHLSPVDGPEAGVPMDIHVPELKAVFFVKDFQGNPDYHEHHDLDAQHTTLGRPIKVVFLDGEVIVGTTTGYQPSRPGFFIEPADVGSNNERCYVVAASTIEVSFL